MSRQDLGVYSRRDGASKLQDISDRRGGVRPRKDCACKPFIKTSQSVNILCARHRLAIPVAPGPYSSHVPASRPCSYYCLAAILSRTDSGGVGCFRRRVENLDTPSLNVRHGHNVSGGLRSRWTSRDCAAAAKASASWQLASRISSRGEGGPSKLFAQVRPSTYS